MGEIERKRIDQLTPEERADIAHKLTLDYSRGMYYTDMSKKYNIPASAVKKLLAEHAAYVKQARPDTKTLQEEEYRRFYGEMMDIAPDDSDFPALVRSTAIQARLQVMTRLDKLLGHEAPSTTVNLNEKNLMDMVTERFGAGGKGDNVSPMDTAIVEDADGSGYPIVEDSDDYVDGEVVDE